MKSVVVAIATILAVAYPAVSNGQTIEERNLPLQLIDDVDVASLDQGVVTQLHVVPGDRVQVGDLLLELDRDLHEGEANLKDMAWRVAVSEADNDVSLRFSKKTLMLN